MAVKVAEEWLNICGGCEVSILDIGEPLLDLLPQLDFVHMPVLMDHKYFGQTGEGQTLEIPEADVGIISGGELRDLCDVEVVLLACQVQDASDEVWAGLSAPVQAAVGQAANVLVQNHLGPG